MTWRQQQLARRWAAGIFAVAAEEMLHLAQVWNLLAAIGGNPYYWRPNFPVTSNYYPTGLPITLAPFRISTLTRFVQYELPDEQQRHAVCRELGITPADGVAAYGSVAELYTIIRDIVTSIPEADLFIGVKARQVDETLADFPTLIQVVDRASALAAIDLIKEQGEGFKATAATADDPFERLDVDRDGHYGVFRRILQEYQAELARAEQSSEPFEPVRDVIENPVCKTRSDDGVMLVTQPQDGGEDVGRVIQDPYTQEVAELFDRVYLLMLRLLQYVFRNSTDDTVMLRAFSQTAIGLMPTLIKPLAETLTLLPAGEPWGAKTAGPAFGLSRHVTLPEHPATASRVVRERLQELIARAATLADDDRAPRQLLHARHNLERWARQLP